MFVFTSFIASFHSSELSLNIHVFCHLLFVQYLCFWRKKLSIFLLQISVYLRKKNTLLRNSPKFCPKRTLIFVTFWKTVFEAFNETYSHSWKLIFTIPKLSWYLQVMYLLSIFLHRAFFDDCCVSFVTGECIQLP